MVHTGSEVCSASFVLLTCCMCCISLILRPHTQAIHLLLVVHFMYGNIKRQPVCQSHLADTWADLSIQPK